MSDSSRSTGAGTCSTRPVLNAPAGGQIAAVFVPGAEPTRPPPRHVHPSDHRVFPADTPDQLIAPSTVPTSIPGLARAEHPGDRLDLNDWVPAAAVGEWSSVRPAKMLQAADNKMVENR